MNSASQVVACRFLIALVLTAAALFKLAGDFGEGPTLKYGDGSILSQTGMFVVALVELFLAGWMVSSWWERSLGWIQLLLVGMVSVSLVIWLRGEPPAVCGCFGNTPIPWEGHFLILLGLIISLGHLQSMRLEIAKQLHG